jgi:CheY-like chemotaxis protein
MNSGRNNDYRNKGNQVEKEGVKMAKGPKILIVDDDVVLLDLMSRRLERMGYQADRADNGEQAIELVKNNFYDLVITDIYMPKATGIDLIAVVKEKDPLVQVIAITGGAMIEMALEALEKGSYAYLSKPFDHLKVFDHTVKKALEYRRLLLTSRQPQVADAGGVAPDANKVSEERYLDEVLKIIQSIPDALVIVDSNGKLITANPSARELIDAGWNVKSIAPQEFRAALKAGMNGSGASIQVNGKSYSLKATELNKGNGECHVLFMLHPTSSTQIPDSPKATKHLDMLKTCLAWLYKQRLREKEFRVLRAMAVQVSMLEKLYSSNGKSGNHSNGLAASEIQIFQDVEKVLADGPQ